MIRCTFEILEWSLPKDNYTPLYQHGPVERLMSPEDPKCFQVSHMSETGSVTLRITALTENTTVSQDVTVIASRPFVEGLSDVLASAVRASKQAYDVEGWICPWKEMEDE